jgi:diguanylate cyclase (GGDEF)-like protein
MNLEHLDTIRKVWELSKSGRPQFLFFRIPDNYSFSEYIQQILDEVDDYQVIKQVVLHKQEYLPFYPFSEWAKSILKDKKESKLRKICTLAGSYPHHSKLFVDLMKERESPVLEDTVLKDMHYLHERLIRALWEIGFSLTKHRKSIFIIENFQRLPASTFDLLQHIPAGNQHIPILFIFSAPKTVKTHYAEEKPAWLDFMLAMENHSLLLTLEDASSKGTQAANENLPEESIDQIIQHIKTCLNFMAFYDASSLAHMLYSRYLVQSQNFSPEQIQKMHLYCGIAYLHTEDFENAQLHFTTLLHNSKETNNIEYSTRCYLNLGHIAFLKGDYVNSERFINLGLKLANHIKNKRLQFFGLFVQFYLDDRMRKISQEQCMKNMVKYRDLGKEIKQLNMLSMWLINPYFLNSHSQIDLLETYIDEGLEYARILGNEKRIASAYHAIGNLYQQKGQTEKGEYFFTQSELLKTKLGDKRELINVYNGKGYFLFQQGKYEEAHSYYLKSLELLKNDLDVPEYVLTLFNLALNSSLCFHYDKSQTFLTRLIDLMTTGRITSFPWHSIFMVHILLSYSYFRAEKPLKGMEFWIRLQAADFEIWEENKEEILFKQLLLANVHRHEGQFELALEGFKKGMEILMRNKPELYFYIPWYCWEFIQFLDSMSETLEDIPDIESIRSIGEAAAFESKNSFYQNVYAKDYEILIIDPPELEQDKLDQEFTWVLETAKLRRTLNQMNKRIHDVDFLNSSQLIINSAKQDEELIAKSMDIMFHSFICDGIWLIRVHGKHHHFLYENAQFQLSEETILKLLFLSPEAEILIHKSELLNQLNISNLPNEYYHIERHKFSEDQNIFMLSSGNKDFSRIKPETSRIISIGFQQLITALRSLEQQQEIVLKNQALSRAARTDMLTGLYNRAALQEALDSLIDKLQAEEDLSLLFIDLDNFKYYNDTFGHQAGDLILSLLAELLHHSTRKDDFIGRFGGDEFIILLPGAPENAANRIAEIILTDLNKKEGFEDEVAALLEKDISIPKEKRLSCSIGLTSVKNLPGLNPDELILQADKALYQAKEAGKNQIVILEYEYIEEL